MRHRISRAVGAAGVEGAWERLEGRLCLSAMRHHHLFTGVRPHVHGTSSVLVTLRTPRATGVGTTSGTGLFTGSPGSVFGLGGSLFNVAQPEPTMIGGSPLAIGPVLGVGSRQ